MPPDGKVNRLVDDVDGRRCLGQAAHRAGAVEPHGIACRDAVELKSLAIEDTVEGTVRILQAFQIGPPGTARRLGGSLDGLVVASDAPRMESAHKTGNHSSSVTPLFAVSVLRDRRHPSAAGPRINAWQSASSIRNQAAPDVRMDRGGSTALRPALTTGFHVEDAFGWGRDFLGEIFEPSREFEVCQKKSSSSEKKVFANVFQAILDASRE